MKIRYSSSTEICTCQNCNARLHWTPFRDNIYDGGPWYCSRCGANVTKAIYGDNHKGSRYENKLKAETKRDGQY